MFKQTKSVLRKADFSDKDPSQKRVNFMRQQYDDDQQQDSVIANGSKKMQNKDLYDFEFEQQNKNKKISKQDQNGDLAKKKFSSKISSKILIPCLFAFINKVKETPTILLRELEKRRQKYDPQNPLIYYPFGQAQKNFSVKTRQGKDGVTQLLDYLDNLQLKQSKLLGINFLQIKVAKEVKLQWSYELHLAAQERVQAMQKNDSQIQSLDVGQLVSHYGLWKGPLYQIVVYGFFDPKDILIEAFLQDESKNKNNRSQFFNEGAKMVGISMGHHQKYRIVTVMIFSGGFSNNQKNKSFFGFNRTEGEECQCSIC